SVTLVNTSGVISATGFKGDGSSLLWSQTSTLTLSDKISELISLSSPTFIDSNLNVGIGTDIETDVARSNIGIGDGVLESLSDSSGYTNEDNIGIGTNSLGSLTTGNVNIAIGGHTLSSLESGDLNLAIGNSALSSLVSGTYNLAIGTDALLNNQASRNLAIGAFSLENNVGGSVNTAVGLMSMQKNTEGYGNTALGDASLSENINGNYNVAVGRSSLEKNINGSSNVVVGDASGYNNISGTNNTAIGEMSLFKNKIGNYNVAVGAYSLENLDTEEEYQGQGYGNVGIGATSLGKLKRGDQNVGIGHGAGPNTESSTINHSTFIGTYSGAEVDGLDNSIAIGYYATVSSSNTMQLGNQSLELVNTSGVVSASGFKGNADEITLTYSGTLTNVLDVIDDLKNQIENLKDKLSSFLGSSVVSSCLDDYYFSTDTVTNTTYGYMLNQTQPVGRNIESFVLNFTSGCSSTVQVNHTNLPQGIVLSNTGSNTWELSGIPTTPGKYDYSITASIDNSTKTITGTFDILSEFDYMGGLFPNMLAALSGNQVMHNLNNDSWVRHFATPTPFVGGVNNTTYYPRWIDQYWNRILNSVFAPGSEVISIAQANGYDMFVKWSKLIQILGGSRLSAYHGPIIYSSFNDEIGNQIYDSEQELYELWFDELEDIVSTFSSNTDYTEFSEFDATYNGDINKWIKMANSLRLRLAMRIVKIDPNLARTQAENAINDPGGLIIDNSDNMMLSLYGQPFHETTISFAWNDTRMSASMESILGGYDDPRVGQYWDPVDDASLVTDHPNFPYKGIRNGAYLASKELHLPYSTLSSKFNNASDRKLIDAAEVHLILAEAALRGWSTPLSAQAHYEAGITESFQYWGVGGVETYLANNTGIPLDYDDVVEVGDVNDFVSRITATVAWDENGSNEEKLEKIITQKWIAAFTNSVEAWVDHRRTGYPKLPYNYKNDSSSEFGIIGDDEFLKRMVFPLNEVDSNPSGYQSGVNALDGPDEISTRLWWDTGGSNF
ncbi:MAG: SusD/RagB family nutrient-binding outer membrane lipoprotein, partial [Flavobacteriaceae bacterium]